ncbi:flavoprotein [Clostridium sp. Cult1]|uniref:flavoprotein n=1 Tax=Clostridium sp. Cult1 TaxID=2079002 RepID=UPI001F1E691D|nr:flavoprotein [Clostridium sp. Cult1]MCF6463069.1 hypothetical protein [Clostridium sp. Cult1]
MVKNKITLNVLADITKKIGKVDFTQSANRILIVFTGSNIELDERIEKLKGIKEKGIDFSLAFSFMGEKILNVESIINSLNPIEIYGEEDIFQLEEIVEKHSSIIGPNITMNTLSKVTLGMIDSFVPNIIWTFLYKEKPVYLDYTSVRNYLGAPSKNKEIKDIIENHIDKLKRMGAIEVEAVNYGKQILMKENRSILEKDEKGYSSFNKVITERDLINYNSRESLILPKGTIITPLAKDRAKELGIKIEMEK